MPKRNFTVALIASTTLAIAPFSAQAQETQVNTQQGTNNAAAIGNTNLIFQNLDQTNQQTQVDINGWFNPSTPQIQVSGQTGANNGAAVGDANTVGQFLDQINAGVQVGF